MPVRGWLAAARRLAGFLAPQKNGKVPGRASGWDFPWIVLHLGSARECRMCKVALAIVSFSHYSPKQPAGYVVQSQRIHFVHIMQSPHPGAAAAAAALTE